MLTYFFVLVGAFALQRLVASGEITRLLQREVFLFGLISVGVSILAYIDYYFFFSSQTNGVGFVLERTAWHHFFIFWGALYFIVMSFLIYTLSSTWREPGQSQEDLTRPATTWA